MEKLNQTAASLCHYFYYYINERDRVKLLSGISCNSGERLGEFAEGFSHDSQPVVATEWAIHCKWGI
jgi:hypothetical protein